MTNGENYRQHGRDPGQTPGPTILLRIMELMLSDATQPTDALGGVPLPGNFPWETFQAVWPGISSPR
ncbi:MAG: hypothetical protein HKL95_04025 [Phycisphaerae bacterium]|nr:hypothetical protein [Phycisphaerae bacterium]